MGEDNNKVALFSVCLKNDKNLENTRSMQRAFVKMLLESSGCPGALAAFYTKGEPDNTSVMKIQRRPFLLRVKTAAKAIWSSIEKKHLKYRIPFSAIRKMLIAFNKLMTTLQWSKLQKTALRL